MAFNGRFVYICKTCRTFTIFEYLLYISKTCRIM